MHTVCCTRTSPVHGSTLIVVARSRTGRVCDALGVQAKATVLWVVLRNGKRPRDNLGLMTIAPSCLVLLRILTACWPSPLEISVVEDLGDVCDRLAGLNWYLDHDG